MTERRLRATRNFDRSTSRIVQCNKAAGYARYQSRVGDGDKYTNIWKMLTSTTTKLAKHDFTIIPLDIRTPVSMAPAIDPNMVLMMNAKEGQPAYWRTGEHSLEFVWWATPVLTPDSQFQVAKDRLVVKVAHIKNCEEWLACMKERLKLAQLRKPPWQSSFKLCKNNTNAMWILSRQKNQASIRGSMLCSARRQAPLAMVVGRPWGSGLAKI